MDLSEDEALKESTRQSDLMAEHAIQRNFFLLNLQQPCDDAPAPENNEETQLEQSTVKPFQAIDGDNIPFVAEVVIDSEQDDILEVDVDVELENQNRISIENLDRALRDFHFKIKFKYGRKCSSGLPRHSPYLLQRNLRKIMKVLDIDEIDYDETANNHITFDYEKEIEFTKQLAVHKHAPRFYTYKILALQKGSMGIKQQIFTSQMAKRFKVSSNLFYGQLEDSCCLNEFNMQLYSKHSPFLLQRNLRKILKVIDKVDYDESANNHITIDYEEIMTKEQLAVYEHAPRFYTYKILALHKGSMDIKQKTFTSQMAKRYFNVSLNFLYGLLIDDICCLNALNMQLYLSLLEFNKKYNPTDTDEKCDRGLAKLLFFIQTNMLDSPIVNPYGTR